MIENHPEIDWDAFDTDVAALARQHGFHPCAPPGAHFAAWHRPARGARVYLSAGIHGDEPAGPLAIREIMRADWFAALCTDPQHSPDITICPALNPDGLRAGTRGNRDGHDLNRDYQQFKTPETSRHAAWLLARPIPQLFISLHEDWETSGFYFYEINLIDDRPARARELLDAMHPIMSADPAAEIDGHAVREPGWIFHEAEADLPDAWPEAIFLAKNGCPLSFTLETPSQQPLANRVAAHLAATKHLITHAI